MEFLMSAASAIGGAATRTTAAAYGGAGAGGILRITGEFRERLAGGRLANGAHRIGVHFAHPAQQFEFRFALRAEIFIYRHFYSSNKIVSRIHFKVKERPGIF
jgi:hypothetical protein